MKWINGILGILILFKLYAGKKEGVFFIFLQDFN